MRTSRPASVSPDDWAKCMSKRVPMGPASFLCALELRALYPSEPTGYARGANSDPGADARVVRRLRARAALLVAGKHEQRDAGRNSDSAEHESHDGDLAGAVRVLVQRLD